jgi:3-hydroxyisobutyrate dehydrogenase
MADDTRTVAVLGTGIMGGAMARRLLGAGMHVRVWNRTRERAAPLGEAGATVAGSPAEAADGADTLLTALTDGDAVEAAVFGPDGAALAAAPRTLWVQVSTIGARAADRLARTAIGYDLVMVDAPVLGSREGAEQGALVVLASGPDDARSRCQPLFDAIGQRTLWVGPAGAGSRLKLVVNAWLLGLLGALAEAVALAQRSGIDPRRFLEAIEGGPIFAPYARLKGEAMLAGEFPASFPLRLAHKDARLALGQAAADELPMPLLAAVAEQLGRAIQLGHGDDDVAAVYFAVTGNRVLR